VRASSQDSVTACRRCGSRFSRKFTVVHINSRDLYHVSRKPGNLSTAGRRFRLTSRPGGDLLRCRRKQRFPWSTLMFSPLRNQPQPYGAAS